MNLTFHGAAREVTGSQYILAVGSKQLLLECGLFQGRREEAYRKNRHPEYSAFDLDAVMVSHAHLDHTGKLPRLAGLGYEGPVFATPITAALCDPMLKDSAHIQEKDVEFVNKLHRRKGKPLFNVLYDLPQTEKILKQFVPQPLQQPFPLMTGVTAQFIEAGHVLGSAQVVLECHERGRTLRIGFTGDLGRKGLPVLRDPERLSDLDVLLMESTYGNRDHDPLSETGPELREVIQSTYERGGKLIIPAFALERTQELLYHLAQLHDAGELPADMPVYVDSPLAVKCTEIFARHAEAYDAETQSLLANGTNPFDFPGLHFIQDVQDSMALNDDPNPMIIIAASGMMEAGRILHHLRNHISNPRNTVLIVSYQAEHTLGRRIADRMPQVNIFGEPHALNARVKILNTFSGHAGRADLIEYVRGVYTNSPRLKQICVVHGEPDQALPLIESLREFIPNSIRIDYPKSGDTIPL